MAEQETQTPKEPRTAQELVKMRKRRNMLMLWLVFGLAVLFYIVTILKTGS